MSRISLLNFLVVNYDLKSFIPSIQLNAKKKKHQKHELSVKCITSEPVLKKQNSLTIQRKIFFNRD